MHSPNEPPQRTPGEYERPSYCPTFVFARATSAPVCIYIKDTGAMAIPQEPLRAPPQRFADLGNDGNGFFLHLRRLIPLFHPRVDLG